MKRDEGQDVRLNLLLEDYPKRLRQWLDTVAFTKKRRAGRPESPPSKGVNHHPIHLLLEEYPSRNGDWLAVFDSKKAPGGPLTFAESELPRLRLLLEDYDPASRAHAIGKPAATAAVSETARRPAPSGLGGIRLAEGELDLNLLRKWDDDLSAVRKRQAGALSMAVHAVLIMFLLLQPYVSPAPPPLSSALDQREVTLLMPPDAWLLELTQAAPNQGPVDQQFQGPSEIPVPVFAPPEQAEAAPPELRSLPELAPPEVAPEPPQAPDPPTVEAEPPKPESPPPTPAAQSPRPGELRPGTEMANLRKPNELPLLNRPKSTPEKPKLELETPKATMPGREGRVQLGSLTLNAPPGQMIEGAIEELAKGGGGRQAVGDDFGTGGLGGYLPPSPGNAGSNLELLSDPKGVDFRPYLIQVLAAVRRNWYAVIPESARLGFIRGRTAIQFAIVRNGTVSKLVIASPSGAQPLDRAAVAGISASNPFPPLPSEYPGTDIRLQFVFLYNIKNQ